MNIKEIEKIRYIHEIYNKHSNGDICSICLKGLENKLYSHVNFILKNTKYSKQEIAESGLLMSHFAIYELYPYVDWNKVEKINIVDELDYNEIVNKYPELEPKLYIQKFDIYYIKKPIEINRINKFYVNYYGNPNIAKYLIGDKTNLYIYNPCNINKNNFKYFLEYPNLYIRSYLPEKLLKLAIEKDIKYIAYIYPRSMIKIHNLLFKIPDEIIQLIHEVDKKANLNKIDYSNINVKIDDIFSEECNNSAIKLKGASYGLKGYICGGVGIEKRLNSRYYYRVTIKEILGYAAPKWR